MQYILVTLIECYLLEFETLAAFGENWRFIYYLANRKPDLAIFTMNQNHINLDKI